MASKHSVAIFWDYENCSLESKSAAGRVVRRIADVAHEYGDVVSFKAYNGFQMPNQHRPDLHCSGVSMIDCPHNGYKEVVDNTLIVDMLAFAIDCPSPATVVLISGDRDYVYALSVLRLRRYRVVVIAPRSAHSSLLAQASVHVDWRDDVLGKDGSEPVCLPLPEGRRPESLDRIPLGASPSLSNHKGKQAVFNHEEAGPSGSASNSVPVYLPLPEGRRPESVDRIPFGASPSLSNPKGKQAVFNHAEAGPSGGAGNLMPAVERIGVESLLPVLPPECRSSPKLTPPEPLALPEQDHGMPLATPNYTDVPASTIPSKREGRCDGPVSSRDLVQSAGVSTQPPGAELLDCTQNDGAHRAPGAIVAALVEEPLSFVPPIIGAASGLSPSLAVEEPSDVSTEAADRVSPSNAQSDHPRTADNTMPQGVTALSEQLDSCTHPTVTAAPTEAPGTPLEDFADGSGHDSTLSQRVATTTEAFGPSSSLKPAPVVPPGVGDPGTLTQEPEVSIAPREPLKIKQSFLESCRKTWNSLLPVTRTLPTPHSSLPVVAPSASTECSRVTATSGMTSPTSESARSSLLSLLSDHGNGPFLAPSGVLGPCTSPDSREHDPPYVAQTSPSNVVVQSRDRAQMQVSSSSRLSSATGPEVAVVHPHPPAQHPPAQATLAMVSSGSRQAETGCSSAHEPLNSSTPAMSSANTPDAQPVLDSEADMPVESQLPFSDARRPSGDITVTPSAGASSRPTSAMVMPSSVTKTSSSPSVLAGSSAGATGSLPAITANAVAANSRQANDTLFRGLLLELRGRNLASGCIYTELARALERRDPLIYHRAGIEGKGRQRRLFKLAVAAGIITLVRGNNCPRTESLIRLTAAWRS